MKEKIEDLFNQLENGEINITELKNFVIDLLEKESEDMEDFFNLD